MIEHGLCACTVENSLAKARGLFLRTGAQTMLYLSFKPNGNRNFRSPSPPLLEPQQATLCDSVYTLYTHYMWMAF